jgi:hypothetical protein
LAGDPARRGQNQPAERSGGSSDRVLHTGAKQGRYPGWLDRIALTVADNTPMSG